MISPRFCYYLVLLLGVVADASFNFGVVNAPLQDCVGEVIDINERVLVRMTGTPEDLTPTEIGLFETSFLETYNILAVPACYGGSYITITSVNVQEDFLTSMEVGGNSTGGTTKEFTLRVQIIGICRGCEKDSLFTLSTKRRLEEEASGLDEGDNVDSRGDTGASESAHDYSQTDRDTQDVDEIEEWWDIEDDLTRSGGKGKGKGTPSPSAAPSPFNFFIWIHHDVVITPYRYTILIMSH
jgi:hypothetical protein